MRSNKIKSFVCVVLAAVVSTVITGCGTTARVLDRAPLVGGLFGEDGYVRDRKDEYLQAETLERTRIPDNYDSYVIDDLYVIPEVDVPQLTESGATPRPRPLEGSTDREIVIQRIGEESWIVAGASPSQIWPRVKDFWLQSNIPLAYENPTTGVMETSWFRRDEVRITQEKLQASIEPGFQDNSAEIRILHMSTPSLLPAIDQVTWPEKSMDQEFSDEVTNTLSSYLADLSDSYQAQTVSFLAGNISSEGKASLIDVASGQQLLQLLASYERSWAAIGLVLNRTEGIEVLTRNQEEGVYEVNYTIVDEDEEEKGFLSKLFTFDYVRGPDPVYTIRINVVPSGSAVLVDTVELSREGKGGIDDAALSLLRLIRRVIA